MNSKVHAERIKVSEIYVDSSSNPRQITQESLDILEKSIEKFGVLQPIVVNKRTNKIIAGHQRFEVLKKTNEYVDAYLIDIDEFDEPSANIALNQEVAIFDEDKVKKIFEEIEGEDLKFTGFSSEQIASFVNDIDTELEDQSYELTNQSDLYKVSLSFSSLEQKIAFENFIDICKSKAKYNRPITDYMFELINKIQSSDEVY